MTMERLILKAIFTWQKWRLSKRLHRKCPRVADLRHLRAEVSRSHGRTKAIDAELREVMTGLLSGKAVR
jgi:hypothetical protein